MFKLSNVANLFNRFKDGFIDFAACYPLIILLTFAIVATVLAIAWISMFSTIVAASFVPMAYLFAGLLLHAWHRTFIEGKRDFVPQESTRRVVVRPMSRQLTITPSNSSSDVEAAIPIANDPEVQSDVLSDTSSDLSDIKECYCIVKLWNWWNLWTQLPYWVRLYTPFNSRVCSICRETDRRSSPILGNDRSEMDSILASDADLRAEWIKFLNKVLTDTSWDTYEKTRAFVREYMEHPHCD